MKEMFESNAYLTKLSTFLKDKVAGRSEALIKHQKRRISPGTKASTGLDQEQQHFQATRAAKTVQRFWRAKKIKDSLLENPYTSYLSLIDPEDNQRLLSDFMFGRHVAEIAKDEPDHIDNVFVHDAMFYHRVDDFQGKLMDLLLGEFGIVLSDNDDYARCIPISLLRTTPIEWIIDKYHSKTGGLITLVKDDEHAIAMLRIAKDATKKQIETIKTSMRSYGLIASPWEIATNIKHTPVEITKHPLITRSGTLPKTKEALLKSNLFGKLNLIAASDRHLTRLLAKSLKKMLENSPKLNADAVQRIALMLDITNTFYAHNYSRYAFCVYTIIHEISLSMLDQKDKEQLKKEFDDFWDESLVTFKKAFGLSEGEEAGYHSLACPALSGTNAYAIAKEFAATFMQTESGLAPTIKAFGPIYYEFEYITSMTDSLDADIFLISAGPIVSFDGLTPGVDINLLVRRHIIDTHRTKPTTIIIDTTTALYNNLKLDDDVQSLVKNGSVSLIVIESHQKFGLIHSDQAQYGRVFGVFSKKSFEDSALRSLFNCGKIDFKSHIDMRIGAFISSHCGEVLEEIKKQHFINGALLRNMLLKSEERGAKYVDASVETYDEMLTNLDELYFSLINKNRDGDPPLDGLVSVRDSFGHYTTTCSGILDIFRLSPGASDDIDSFITASLFCLKLTFESSKPLMSLVSTPVSNSKPLSLEHQILALATLNFYILDNYWEMILPSLINNLAKIGNILDQCPLLKGRESYLRVQSHLVKLQEQASKEYHPKNHTAFFQAIQILYQSRIEIKPSEIKLMIKQPALMDVVIQNSTTLTKELFNLAKEKYDTSGRAISGGPSFFATSTDRKKEEIHPQTSLDKVETSGDASSKPKK